MCGLTWRRNGQSFGKRLLRLRVQPKFEEQLTLTQSFKREAWKYGPVFVPLIFGMLYIIFLFPGGFEAFSIDLLDFGSSFWLTWMLSFVPFLLWWIWPLINWKSEMPYDRLAKTRIEQVERA